MKDAQNQIMQLVSKQEKRDEGAEAAAQTKDTFGAGPDSHFMNSAYIDDDDENIQYPGSEA